MGVQILSYELLNRLSKSEKLKKIISITKKGDVVMIEGKINPEEETELISMALESVSGRFTGIEVAYLNTKESKNILDKIKNYLIKILIKNRIGITVIGPSKIIKEIKMDPEKLEILFK